MLEAAWRSDPAGSLAANFVALSAVTRLETRDVEANFHLLTQNWQLSAEDGRLYHPMLRHLAVGLQERFGEQLEVMAESAALAMQGSDKQFELLPSSELKKRKGGKTAVPLNFSMDTTTLARAIETGYRTAEQQNWLVVHFLDVWKCKNERKSDWQAAMRVFMGSTLTRREFQGHFRHELGAVLSVVKSSGRDMLAAHVRANPAMGQTFAERTRASNANAFTEQFGRDMERIGRKSVNETHHAKAGTVYGVHG